MDKKTKLFESLNSIGEITIVQTGFLYSDTVDTRRRTLILKDFLTLWRYFLKNKYLKISFEIEGKESADAVATELKKFGISVEVIRNELFWIIELDEYEVDILLYIDLPEERVKELIEGFHSLVDAALVYPVGYMSWGEFFKKEPHLV